MVVMQRSEVNRLRLLTWAAIAFSVLSLVWAVSLYSQGSGGQVAAVVVAVAALITIGLGAVQLIGYPKRSQIVMFHRDDEMVIATNNLHEGFKLRFLRDVLTEQCSSFSDEQRARWKPLEGDGYYPALFVRNPRKVLILRYGTLMFDDVFIADRSNRWEHWESSNTSEPTFNRRESPRFKEFRGQTP